MHRLHRLGAVATALIAISAAAHAQTTNRDFRRHAGLGSPGMFSGQHDVIVAVGDVDGDSFIDYALGNATDGTGGLGAGAAHLVSGKTGSSIWSRFGSGGPSGCASSDSLGWSIVVVPDVDGDGINDVAVASPGHAPSGTCATAATGRVQLVSTRTGNVIRTFFGGAAGDAFGRDLATIGGDLLAVANAAGTSVVRLSVTTGTLLFNYPITVPVASPEILIDAGDYDGNGTAFEFAIAVGGLVQVINGVTGNVIDAFTPSAGAFINEMKRFPGGGTGSIRDALLIALPFEPAGINAGQIFFKNLPAASAVVFASGTTANEFLGSSLDASSDIDGDGSIDVITSGLLLNGTGTSFLRIFNAAGATTTTIGDGGASTFKFVAGLGDVDQNGFKDFAVVRDQLSPQKADVVLMEGGPLATMNVNFGPGCPRAPGGQATLTPNALAIPGQSFNHTAGNLAGYDSGIVAVGFPSATGITISTGCTLWMQSNFTTIQWFPTGGATTFATNNSSLPATPSLVGITLVHEVALTVPGGGSQQIGLTNACTLTIGW